MSDRVLTLRDLKWGDMFEFADEERLSGWTVYMFLGVSQGLAAYELQMTSRMDSGGSTLDSRLDRPVKNVSRSSESR